MKLKLLGLPVLLACATLQAHAIGRLADVVVVDRNSGALLPTHYYRGEYWVAGKPGARYAISVRNLAGERLLAVTSVDGVNVVSGETAAWEQTGYVFRPHLHYQITGWRKSNNEVAAFEFSEAGDSYAGRTGRPANVGVIGVALFREKPPEPLAGAPDISQRSESGSDKFNSGLLRFRSDATSVPPAATAPTPTAPAAGATSGLADRSNEAPALRQAESSQSERRAKAAEPMPTPKLGTAHGQRETSVVSHTSFERAQTQPSEVIRIRYDSRENLVASGVIREPVAPPQSPAANPFPLSSQATYVPDPPLRRY